MKTDGSNNQLISNSCFGFYIFDEYIFVTEGIAQFDEKIIRYNLDGTAGKVIVENNNQFLHPRFANNGYLYFTLMRQHSRQGVLQLDRIKFDGTGRQTIIQQPDVGNHMNIFYNNGFIYYDFTTRFAENSENVYQIFKINADGTDKVKLFEYTPTSKYGFNIFSNHIYSCFLFVGCY